MPVPAIREKNINLRATPAQKALIERAAESAGVTRTAFVLDASLQRAEAAGETRKAFMLDASLQRAEAILADRTRFELPAAQMDRFLKSLEVPLPDKAALKKLLSRKPRWER